MKRLACSLILAGFLMIAAYLWAAVIVPWGEADQSRLFWYAFLPLFGIIAVRAGLRLRHRDRTRRSINE